MESFGILSSSFFPVAMAIKTQWEMDLWILTGKAPSSLRKGGHLWMFHTVLSGRQEIELSSLPVTWESPFLLTSVPA